MPQIYVEDGDNTHSYDGTLLFNYDLPGYTDAEITFGDANAPFNQLWVVKESPVTEIKIRQNLDGDLTGIQFLHDSNAESPEFKC